MNMLRNLIDICHIHSIHIHTNTSTTTTVMLMSIIVVTTTTTTTVTQIRNPVRHGSILLLLLRLLHSSSSNYGLDTRDVHSSKRSTISTSGTLEDDAFHALADGWKSLEEQWVRTNILLGTFRDTSESP